MTWLEVEFSKTSTEQTKARTPRTPRILRAPPPSPQVAVGAVGDVTCKHGGAAEGVGVGVGALVDGVATDGVAALCRVSLRVPIKGGTNMDMLNPDPCGVPDARVHER